MMMMMMMMIMYDIVRTKRLCYCRESAVYEGQSLGHWRRVQIGVLIWSRSASRLKLRQYWI